MSQSCENTLLSQYCVRISFTSTDSGIARVRESQPTSELYLRASHAQCTEVTDTHTHTLVLQSACVLSLLSSLPVQLSISSEAMNTGICVYVLLAALSTSTCLALPAYSQDQGQSDRGTVPEHPRAAGQPNLLSETDAAEDPRSSLTELLARLISAKGTYRRSPSPNSRGASHRIKDRDYLGWMDFGRRSAEEYEYSS